MSELEAVIGLEVHLQLKTRTKLFCRCPVEFAAPPNSRVCPVCLGYPGSLPVPSREAVRLALICAHALNCRVNLTSSFDRKNYFYPDLPKGYQITQHYTPLAEEGYFEFEFGGGARRVRIQRIQLEEDSGKIIYRDDTGEVLVDMNRCGVPLVEIITEPDIGSPGEARAFLEQLRRLFTYIGVSDCDMEKGQLRCDVNLSVRPKGSDILGVRTEIKNLNSFSQVEEALSLEFERQVGIVGSGGRIEQQTLDYDPKERRIIVQRRKEFAHDYRYFPEPDLPPLVLERQWVESLKEELPELPLARQRRFISRFGLRLCDAAILTSKRGLADYFEAALGEATPKAVANWLITDLTRLANERGKEVWELGVAAEDFGKLVALYENGDLTNLAAKQALRHMVEKGCGAEEAVRVLGVGRRSDVVEIEALARRVVEENPKAVVDYIRGKDGALKFLMGSLMRASRGSADPKIAIQTLKKILDAKKDACQD